MNLMYKETHIFWRILSFGIIPKYKAIVYNASDTDVANLKEWLQFQGIKYLTDRRAYYAAKNMEDAEKYKPKITIYVRTEDKLAALKLSWS